MKAVRMLIVAIGAACIASTAAGAPAANDKRDIRALEDRFAAAVSAKDLDAIMKVYAPGQNLFVFDVVPPRDYAGWDAYRKDWQTFLGTLKGPLKFAVSDLDVHSDGTLAYSHSIQHMSGTDTANKPFDLTVRVTDVYRKGAGGWRIVQEHVSVPVDLNTNRPDLASAP
ncbi:MAG: YybH family protein [Rhizomicrobium sp.]